MTDKEKYPYFVLLLAGYPSLALMGHNIAENQAYVVIRPLLMSLLLGWIILTVSRLLFKSYAKAGLFTTIFLFIFFSFGHILEILTGKVFLGIDFGRFKVLALAAILILLIAGLGIRIIRKVPAILQSYLTAVSVVLLAMPVYQIVSYPILKSGSDDGHSRPVQVHSINPSKTQNLPDIYYIILDSYTRQDVLLENYNFDNTAFINELKARDFYIADCSRSNYQFTLLSLSSTFNMDYLDQLDSRFQPNGYRVDFMEALIDQSQVRSDLESAGYKIIAFQSSYDGTTIEDADQVVTRFTNPAFQTLVGYMNPFEEMFLNTTAATGIVRLPPGRGKDVISRILFADGDEAITQVYQLETMPTVAREAGPKFVFMHMNIPHQPFIFQADGSWVVDPNYYSSIGQRKEVSGYINQVEFVNSRIPAMLDQILTSSKSDPIIIVQGDHGMNKSQRSYILNAYHVPDNIRSRLYSSITPVNTYRILLTELLGLDYPPLPDRTFASDHNTRFNIIENFEEFPGCTAPVK
jgi:hypothetical protein